MNSFNLCRFLTCISAVVLSTSLAYAAVDFEKDVSTVLIKRCVECHDTKNAKGGLDLTSLAGLVKGGESGTAVTRGNSSASFLIERITSGEMPPPVKGLPQALPAEEIKTLIAWIDEGLAWPSDRTLDLYEQTTDVRGGRDWWAFQPITNPPLPTPIENMTSKNAIDLFIHARLQKQGLTPAAPATRNQLLRRVYYDLTGLPPSPATVAAFNNNDSENAYEKVVDDLLSSKHFGERWARHWLDLVRFAETCGYERDQLKPNIWKYRDWVVAAFNDDMPYDKFITDQLAGDEVPYRDEQTLIATGMIRAGTWNDEPNDPADYQYTRLEDMVHTTSSAFIGLTVKCARCHDHKFDPIRQTDYYRFANAFWSGFIGQANLGGPSEKELGATVFGWTDRSAEVAPLHRLINGERQNPAEVVRPASLSTIPSLERVFDPPPENSKTTTQRLQLAKWITDPNNPLTSRVIVNRLWQHTMGEPIVRSPNNFGFKGELPTHPALLDYLSTQLLQHEWKLKPIIKMIVMSHTYRQASQHRNHLEYSEKDYLNKYWWRANRKRLDAEQLRDSILATSGQLNRASGGPSFFPQMSPEALEGLSRKAGAWGTSTVDQRNRRSIYMMTKRSRLLPLMTTFNFTDTTLPCGQRDVTTVATQALALLNNQFIHQQSLAFADRLFTEHPDDSEIRIVSAWRLATGREPIRAEIDASQQHIAEQSEHFASVTEFALAQSSSLSVKEGLSLWLDATKKLEIDKESRVIAWGDSSGSSLDGQQPIDAAQGEATTRPLYVPDGLNGIPTIRFNGSNQYLKLTAAPITNPHFSIIAVARDNSDGTSHREIFSNWNSRGRSTNSVFLGTTKNHSIRFSDAFNQAGQLPDATMPFLITASNSSEAAQMFLNGTVVADGNPITGRVLTGPYVLGTQGNYNSEFWLGDISEILVYDRALSRSELDQIWGYLAQKYKLRLAVGKSDPHRLALASLCHVLFNTNEYIYID